MTESTESTPSRLRFLVTPRWIGLEVAVVLFVLACYFLLAPWQFARSHQHDSQMNAIATATAAAPIDVDALLSPGREPGNGIQWRTATATGHFDAANEGYVRLRQDNDGNPAFEVVVPFITDTGTVLLDRGYVSFQAVQEDRVDLPPLPSGIVTITGRVQPDQTDPKNRAPITTPDGRTAYTEVSSKNVADSVGPVYRGYLQLIGNSPGVTTEIALPQSDDSRPFFSYAIQWLSFGAIAILGLATFAYREYNDPVDGTIYITSSDERADGGNDASRAPSARMADSAVLHDHNPPHDPTSTPADILVKQSAKFDKSQLYDEWTGPSGQ
ncbi:MAG: SURF1 family cytochrome oxidase biogenesis protein [Nakamurella sp.]